VLEHRAQCEVAHSGTFVLVVLFVACGLVQVQELQYASEASLLLLIELKAIDRRGIFLHDRHGSGILENLCDHGRREVRQLSLTAAGRRYQSAAAPATLNR
jgi:hypothetical protein